MSHFFHDDGAPAGRGQKVCLATVVYDKPEAAYTFSLMKTRQAMDAAGIPTAYMLLAGNCHVDDARNTIIQNFMLTDCTDLVFLDADVSWNAKDLVQLCSYDRDFVGAVYPFRRRSNAMPVRMVETTTLEADGLLEVEGLPTGFMRLRRCVLERLAATAEHYWNRGDRRGKIPILFERTFADDIRWGGDLAFCNKWRATGGKVYAAPEIRLGHTGDMIEHESLGAWIRRDRDETLRHVAQLIRGGSENANLLAEARDCVGNPYSAMVDVLMLCVLMARKADGPIIEAGSGLTTILMAAATDQTVFCLEHDPIWAAELEKMAQRAGVNGIGLCLCPVRDGWYDTADFPDLPERFALGVNDGPPRRLGSRMGFYDRFGAVCDTIVADDADDRSYGDAIEAWSGANGRTVDFVDERAALIRKPEAARSAA